MTDERPIEDAVQTIVRLSNPDGSYILKFDKYLDSATLRRMLRFDWSEVHSVSYVMDDVDE